MAVMASDLLRHFDFLSATAKQTFPKLDRK